MYSGEGESCMPLKWPSLPDNGSITEKNGEDRLESIYFMYLSRGQFRREYVYIYKVVVLDIFIFTPS